MRPHRSETRILKHRILSIWGFTVIFESVAPSTRTDGAGRLGIHHPMDNVDFVRAKIRYLAARVVPEPAKVVQRAVRVVGTQRRRTQPHVVVKPRGRSRIGRRAKSRHDVAKRSYANADYLSEISGSQQLERPPV